MRVIGYVRVSTDEQADSGAGLAAQRSAIESEVAQRDELELVEILTDAGYSAKNTNRPALQDALRRLKAHHVDGLVVAKLDRLSRSVVDFAGIMEISQRQGWEMILLDFNIDTTTAQGEMIANVMATMAQFERKLIGQRTREAMAAKKAAGVVFGGPNRMDEVLRARIRAEREAGASLCRIAEGLNAESVPTVRGGARWWPSTVRAALV